MLQPAGSLIPLICISPASPEKSQPAPCPPFPDDEEEADNDGFRAKHLSPPPNIPPRYPSPLRQSGLGREQLDVLLKVSRERKAILGGQKAPDLRKELAITNQKNKQPLFLSKVAEPPSPTATTIPKTPPEVASWLESPRAVFALTEGWVEQIDFRIPIGKQCSAGRAGPRKFAPSLDEITVRMGSTTVKRSSKDTVNFSNRRRDSQLPGVTAEFSPKLNVGRLHMPLRELSPGALFADDLERCIVQSPPSALLTPALQVTTTFVPRTVRATPLPLSESNLHAFSRSYIARDVIRMLKRRSLSPPPPGGCDQRRSAPAELHDCGRIGFQHDMLSTPGSF
ncbi:hypothetical protein BKA83DRAFT_673720 [Pisolithus microcarpus]|nr:hypothetical protein BKA83DRAFT_673720 [Pisolithus microcarpus]